MGGGSGGGTQTTKTEPWKGQQPYLRDLFKQAQRALHKGAGQEYYPGQQVAGFSPMTSAGLDQMYGYGMQGSPLQQPMQQFLGQSMMNPAGMAGVGMDMPGQNPYLDAMVGNVGMQMGQQLQQQTLPGIHAAFGGAGRTGGGIHQQMVQGAADDMMRAFGEQATDIYGQDYERAMARDIQRRQLMGDIGIKAATQAPAEQQMQMQSIDQLMRAGAITEDQAQRMIDAEMAKHDFYQQAPWQALQNYAGVVHGMPGGYGTTTGPRQGPSRQQQRFSGAAGGAMAGSQIMPGWGTAIGAGLGYLMS